MKKSIIAVATLLVAVITVYTVSTLGLEKETKIETILASENYSYLPVEAKDYIKVVYEETGEVILTEKNKEEDMPYLNPKYVAYLSLSEEEKENVELIPSVYVVDFSSSTIVEDGTYPSKYNITNLNNKNYTTPFKNQGSLGVCWAMASIEQVESYLLLQENKGYSSTSETFSVRQMDYITSTNGINNYENEIGQRQLTTGGNYWTSSTVMSYGLSLVDDSLMPFNQSTAKKELAEIFNYENSKYELESSIIAPTTSETTSSTEKESYNQFLKENIMKYGGAYVGTGSPAESCGFKNTDGTYAIMDDNVCSRSSGHAMQIIGWDDDYQYTYCKSGNDYYSVSSSGTCSTGTKEVGTGAWILRNSWGSTSSYKYVYLVYDSYGLDVAFTTSLSPMENRTWDNNYHKNMFNNGYFYHSTADSVQYTKVIDTPEKLEKIKFMTYSEGGEFALSIKVGDKNYSNIKTFTVDNMGFYTIDLSDANITLDSDQFTVTIRSTNGKRLIQNTISVFTSNVESTPSIKTADVEQILADSASNYPLIVYSNTKNIASNEKISYSLYKNGVDYSNYIDSVSNNVVAANNVNTTLVLNSSIPAGTYQLRSSYKDYTSESNIVMLYNHPLEGSGTESDPYLISSSEDLSRIKYDLDAHYLLKNDIDLTEDTQEGGKLSMPSATCPQGFGWESINGFSGSLDGNGHTIRGLYQNNYLACTIKGENWKEWNNGGNGLFGTVSGNVSIRNLVLEDFDMSCQGGNCGVLASKYINDSDEIENHPNFENIIVRNSKVKGVYNPKNSNSSLVHSYGGGLLGSLVVPNAKTTISNIYLDIDIDASQIEQASYLASDIEGGNITISNIQLEGELVGDNSDGSGASILIGRTYGDISINNVLSTVTTKNVGGLLGEVWQGSLSINNVNMLNLPNGGLCYRDSYGYCSNSTNINIYDENQLAEFTKQDNYDSWDSFDTNWIIRNVDGISRIPVLRIVDFEYTSIPRIVVNQELNKKVNIYDYIVPNIKSAKRIKYSSNDENIVKIDSDGTIIPQSSGTTIIHIESYYDGYIKDVPITITYVPHYNIVFDANGGTGTMDSIEVKVNENYQLPKNAFTKTNYVLKEWNTSSDGTGESYQDLGQVKAMNDKETITLYAQWIGEEMTVIFNPNFGTVTPNSKKIRYGEIYGDLPIPTRDGYAFGGWSKKSGNISIVVGYNTKYLGENLINADWRENAYNIIYDANGGILKSDYEIDYRVLSKTLLFDLAINNSDTKIYPNNYEKSGYVFKEWNTKADGTGTSYQENEVINLTNVENSTLKLYAQWEEKKYTIKFDANGGIGTMDNKAGKFNSNLLLPSNQFTKTGYQFINWNTKIDGTGISLGDGTTVTIDENLFGENDTVTLYAQWQLKERKITFYANDGTPKKVVQPVTVSNPVALAENIFIREGYKFIGWNTKADGTGTSYSDGESISFGDSIELYAQWEKEIPFIIDRYNYDASKKFISKIPIGTEFNEFQSNIKLESGYRLEVDSKIINEKNVMFTGGITNIYKGTSLYISLVNIVSGDVNGDGKVNSADYVKVRKHIMTTELINNPIYFEAADINSDDKISSADYVRIRKYIMNGGSL